MNTFSPRLFSLIALMLLSACQNTTTYSPVNNIRYGDYYLWLKTLSDQELIKEVNLQKQLSLITKNTENHEQSDVKLLLLYSLPNSPIHNPYTAKSKLNQYQLAQQGSSRFNVDNLALIQLLRDQLNEQLLLFHQMMEKEKIQDKQQVIIETKNKNITQLQQQLAQLQEQLTLLKNIETNIDQHGKHH